MTRQRRIVDPVDSRAVIANQDREGDGEATPERAATGRDLQVTLDTPLPASLPVDSGTAIFLIGSCFHLREPVHGLEILVDGVPHPSRACRMPRPDLSRSRQPASRSHRSGFWATIPIEGRDRPGAVGLGAAARLASGERVVAMLGRIPIVEPREHPSYEGLPTDRDLIAICMATFEPVLTLFRRQIESLRAQTDASWICLISDDCSRPERFDEILHTVAGDRRFVVSRSPRRLGFYRNFERALGMVPREAALVALCDQDDRWYPEKLEVLRGALAGAELVYSDQRLVDAEGRVLRETLWEGRRNNHTNIASLLVANTVTGAATLFRREVAERALPFPDPPGWQFHDHWLGLVALAMGDVAYVPRPLYDYVQHADAIFGDVSGGGEASATTQPSGWRVRLQRWRSLMTRWRAAYFYGYLGRAVQAEALLARSLAVTARKRRALRRFASSDRSPVTFAWLAIRPLRAVVGRNETLGSEAQLATGILWRWLIGIAARLSAAGRFQAVDASPPGLEWFEQTRLRRWRAGR